MLHNHNEIWRNNEHYESNFCCHQKARQIIALTLQSTIWVTSLIHLLTNQIWRSNIALL